MQKIKQILTIAWFLLILSAFSTVTSAATYKYDDLGRLIEVTYDSGIKITYTYDAAGNILTVSNTVPLKLNPIGNKTVNEGELLQFTVSAASQEGSTLAFSASNLPEGAVFDAESRTFTWTPSYEQQGIYNDITFKVTDGKMTDFQSISITVTDVKADNTEPGDNIKVVDPDTGITLVFDEVKASGNTTVEVYDSLPFEDNSGITFIPVYYDINTSAEFEGAVRIKLKYDVTGFENQEEKLRLYQFNDGVPTDITSPVNPGPGGNPDTAAHTIEGVVEHFCFFAIGVDNTSSGETPSTIECDIAKESIQIKQGDKATLEGSITSEDKLTEVVLSVSGEVYYIRKPDSKTFDLSEFVIDTTAAPFNNVGEYSLGIWAKSEKVKEYTGPLATINVTVTPAEQSGNTEDMQSVILNFVSAPVSQRKVLVNDILLKMDSENYTEFVDDVINIIGSELSEDEIKKALETFVGYPLLKKKQMGALINDIKLSGSIYDTSGFSDIEKKINTALTGNESDSRGLELFVKLFKTINTFNDGNAVFSNSKADPYKIDININEYNYYLIDGKLDALVSILSSLKESGVTDFGEFVAYIEEEINSASDEQIYNFKVFLRYENGKVSYSDNIPVP